jgi:hypothetical protein
VCGVCACSHAACVPPVRTTDSAKHGVCAHTLPCRTNEKILQVVPDPGITAGVEDFSALTGTQTLGAVVVNLTGTLTVDTSVSPAQLPASVQSFDTTFSNILQSIKTSDCLVKSGVIIAISYDHTTWLVHGESHVTLVTHAQGGAQASTRTLVLISDTHANAFTQHADVIRRTLPANTTFDTLDIMCTAGKAGAQAAANSANGQRCHLKDTHRMQMTVVHMHEESLGWKSIMLHGQSNAPSDDHLPPAGSNMCIIGAMNDLQMELVMKSIFDRCVSAAAA